MIAPAREVLLVDAARTSNVHGVNVLQALPSSRIPFASVDPFLLVHDAAVPLTPERASLHTADAHTGIDHLWYVVSAASPGGAAAANAGLRSGALLQLRTARGTVPADAMKDQIPRQGIGEPEMRTVLLWVGRTRADDGAGAIAHLFEPEATPVSREDDAVVRVLVGEASPVQLGTPSLVLDASLPDGGELTIPLAFEFNALVYVLDGEARIGANGWHVARTQTAVLGAGHTVTVAAAIPGTRLLLLGGRPYVEGPPFSGVSAV